jgi:hypothetical protein
MSNEELGKDTIDMLGEIILYEHVLNKKSQADFQTYMKNCNIGRELFDRKFVGFFDTPKKINKKVRKFLVEQMRQIENTMPTAKGDTFDQRYKDLLVSLLD